jgi:hypothetical protein
MTDSRNFIKRVICAILIRKFGNNRVLIFLSIRLLNTFSLSYFSRALIFELCYYDANMGN